MVVSSVGVSEERVAVGETSLHLLKGGSGRPVLVLHGIEGPEGWLAVHEALAQRHTVYAPDHPGFAETPRPDWLETISQQALFYSWFLQEAGLADVDLIGFGIGGWIAAEMAVMCAHNLRHLVLVDAAGVRPRSGQILDIFILPWREVVARCVNDADNAVEFQRIYSASPVVDFGGHREAGRSMAMRMCYRPFMHSPALPHLLPRLRLPTLVVWGAQDRVVPLECGRIYEESIPGASLEVMEGCGHWPHYEQPEALARIIDGFIAG